MAVSPTESPDQPEAFVYRTMQVYEADLVAGAFDEAGIVYIHSQETPGMQLAMPLAPTFGPGVWWLVVVPPQDADRARAVFLTLPLAKQIPQDAWTSRVHPEGVSFLKGLAWINLGALGLWIVFPVFDRCVSR